MDMQYVMTIAKSLLVDGMKNTLFVFTFVVIFSLPLGFLITLVTRTKVFGWLAKIYIFVMRGTPLLLQLLFAWFGIPIIFKTVFNIDFNQLSRIMVASLTFTFNYAAYFAEIFRGGLLAVDKGQYEAARVLGISKFSTTTRVVLPQMIRVSLPSVGNEVITLVKDTSLIYTIGVADVIHYSKAAVNRDVDVTAYVIAAGIYLLLTLVLTLVLRLIEKKFAFK